MTKILKGTISRMNRGPEWVKIREGEISKADVSNSENPERIKISGMIICGKVK